MKSRLTAAAAAVVLLSVPLLSAPVSARPEALSTIAVLANDAYVDMGPIADGGEVENLIDDLEAAGHTVRPFSDISAASITTALDGADVLAIPELEGEEDFYGDLAPDAAAVITDFVSGGGRIVLFYADDAVEGLNALFGASAAEAFGCSDDGGPGGQGDPCLLTAAAAGTEFADGPASLNGVNATDAILGSSLPAGSTPIYTNEVDDELEEVGLGSAALVEVVGVASVPFGDGAIITLGWDWFPDTEEGEGELAPDGVEPADANDEAAWALVLDLAVAQPEVTATAGTDQIAFTSDSPSTQPVFVAVVIEGVTEVVTIPAGSTTATLVVDGPAAAAFSVPGWGVGEGSVSVLGTTAAPPPAVPVQAAPDFTG